MAAVSEAFDAGTHFGASHPREEHLLPLMVAAGASKAAGERVYNELVMETAISGFRFA